MDVCDRACLRLNDGRWHSLVVAVSRMDTEHADLTAIPEPHRTFLRR